MERDFLGLSDKQYLSNVKREANDDDVRERGLSKKVAKQWGKSKLFTNSNFMPPSDFQVKMLMAHEAKPFQQWGSASTASGFRNSLFGGAFQNATPLLLGGSLPLTAHSSFAPRVASSGSSPQLTIFYDGNISVFNDVTPEKAQAIMSCAGNNLKGETGVSSLKKPVPIREVERVYGKKIHNGAAAASSSSATPSDNIPRRRDIPVAATNAMTMFESFNAGPGNLIPSVPQARKASLARFLEKRKERLMSAMPYKKMLLDISTGESTGMNYSST